MTLPVSPASISLQQVNVELGRSSTAIISLGEADVRFLANRLSGAISLADLYGKTYSVAVFTPDGGTLGSSVTLTGYGSGGDDAFVTIDCSVSAIWTWTRTGSTDAYASVSSGGSSTSITFTLPNFGFTALSSTFSVQGNGNGTIRNWTVQLYNTGFS